ncbi:helix-turn-helix domain-containing protein [Pyrococcus abyssi]|uniref:Helix-turn-helix type 11 domain-containing protein n=1 Tax=Pyrococcus abyssi (strain GE5 / Orsay) TaxID=272844 RepID=Q9UZ77_PYRAB|nr:helix-turn-helix domain-containing protein [Pyrococcus abyssi]CAB50182.1 Hypothetical protein PAB1533 [Pyrococcus abyssi GE5]CCE70715.1 TPA: hypothetical protein PAB1533 [Pyrococcus abyssi GE5]
MLVLLHAEGANVRECIRKITEDATTKLPPRGRIVNSRVRIEMGAFFSLSITLVIDVSEPYKPGILVDYVIGGKENSILELEEKFNSLIPPDAEIVDFSWETYTTPVTRRTYAVGVLTYNTPTQELPELKFRDRRKVIAKVLELLNYNPKALNISELARMFNVSRDTIYNDIQQILKGK